MSLQAAKLDGPSSIKTPSESQISDGTNVIRGASADENGSVFAPAPGKPRRMHYGDAVRILGTIAVVIGHVADMRFGGHALDRDWWVANLWDAFTRWAVPAYIMLSGALLLDPAREEAPRDFYRKRLGRIGVPLVFWTAFFMWFRFYVLVPKGWGTTRSVWIDLALGKPYTHLHFIFRIAGLYFFTPMMRVWLRHTTRRMQFAAIVTALALSSADSIMNGITGNEPSVFARFVPFVGYYLLGYLLRDTRISKQALGWCWVGFVGTCLILALGTGLLVKATGGAVKWYPSVNMILYDFLSPVRVIMAVCVWLIFVNSFTEPWPREKRGREIVQWWAATTLGLYLVHPLFRELFYFTKMWDAGKGVWWPNVWIGIPLASLAVYLVALAVTAVLMKIPYVRRITG
jgi:surface polysaccharide O-acyltransferase-like enzyme